ncbi:MAG TPA: response regulator transcription factor, partial [Actinomycetota bacterium]|nr:response regulator transcription factor [Actinomycetota bacterium]
MTALRVLVVDDQRVVREGLRTLVGLLEGVEVVGTAADGEEAVAAAATLRPDVVLMDLRMPRCDGVEATRRLRAQDPTAVVLMLTTYADDRSVIDALRAGARGYLTKDAGAEEIRQALHQVARGQAAIDPAVQHHLVQAVAAGAGPGDGSGDGSGDGEASPAAGAVGGADAGGVRAAELPDGLTPREGEVLALIAEGLSNAEIARRLVVSETTVKSHINHLFAKTGVRDRAQAVTYA